MKKIELPIDDCRLTIGLPNRKSKIKNRKFVGFTLVEVILVAVVLGLLLTASVPRFQQTAQRLQTEQAAFALTQLLRYAHERAVAQGDKILWVWDTDARQAHLEAFQGDNPPQRIKIKENIARSRPIREDITVTLACEGPEGDAVIFSPDGTSDAATLRVVHQPFSYTVTVDAATSQPVLSTTAP